MCPCGSPSTFLRSSRKGLYACCWKSPYFANRPLCRMGRWAGNLWGHRWGNSPNRFLLKWGWPFSSTNVPVFGSGTQDARISFTSTSFERSADFLPSPIHSFIVSLIFHGQHCFGLMIALRSLFCFPVSNVRAPFINSETSGGSALPLTTRPPRCVAATWWTEREVQREDRRSLRAGFSGSDTVRSQNCDDTAAATSKWLTA